MCAYKLCVLPPCGEWRWIYIFGSTRLPGEGDHDEDHSAWVKQPNDFSAMPVESSSARMDWPETGQSNCPTSRSNHQLPHRWRTAKHPTSRFNHRQIVAEMEIRGRCRCQSEMVGDHCHYHCRYRYRCRDGVNSFCWIKSDRSNQVWTRSRGPSETRLRTAQTVDPSSLSVDASDELEIYLLHSLRLVFTKSSRLPRCCTADWRISFYTVWCLLWTEWRTKIERKK